MAENDQDQVPTSADFVDAVLDELQRLLRKAGRGSVAATAAAIRKDPSYFRVQRSRRKVDLYTLFETLNTLAVEPAVFFSNALGRPTLAKLLAAQMPAGEVRDEVLERIERRWKDGELTQP